MSFCIASNACQSLPFLFPQPQGNLKNKKQSKKWKYEDKEEYVNVISLFTEKE